MSTILCILALTIYKIRKLVLQTRTGSLAETHGPEYSDSEEPGTVNSEHTCAEWVSLSLTFANVEHQNTPTRLPRFLLEREREEFWPNGATLCDRL